MPPDQMAQVLAKLGDISTQIAVIDERLKSVSDHEGRIRKLEQWRYGLPLAGVLAAASAALTIYEAMRR